MRKFFPVIATFLCVASIQAAWLPLSKTFIGNDTFQKIMRQGVAENWAALPIGERTTRVGLALVGTPYVNYTLELDNRLESPCVNFRGMDCWTFFETSLACARLLKVKGPPYSQEDLLAMIEMDRYRGGHCNGKFTSRLHHLEDWAYDNGNRGKVRDITQSLGGVPLHRHITDMVSTWRMYRQLRANPSQVDFIRNVEINLSRRGIYYIPKAKVSRIESKLQNGDIICIVSSSPGDYTSHVGMVYRDGLGRVHFLHASKNHRHVLVDVRLSEYLAHFRKDQGIMVVRPNEA
ncbi:MAG: N-acetylmuramoyl-L-alanine amidase-like domain-containing protein [Chthoniobacterales bacterium]